jgi:hypothetical protein
MVTIQLDNDKNYTVKEVIELAGLALDFIGEQAPDNELQFSATDVYWTLRNLLDYVNRQTRGEFTLKRLKKGSWGLEYTDKKAAKRKADERHRREKKRTADYLHKLTGHRPPWG